MRIEDIDDGFVEIIESNFIEKIVCKYDGACTVYPYNKKPQKLNVDCSSYNSQYGIPISFDGSKLFVGSWEKSIGDRKRGLMAYDIESGSLLWRLAEGKIRHIFVYSEHIIALKANSSILKLSINSGDVLGQIKSGSIEQLFDLGYPYILADTISGKLSVVDVEKMLITKKYASKAFNPSSCLSLLIQKAVLRDNTLTISGFEEFPDRNYNLLSSKPFSRVIDTNFKVCQGDCSLDNR